MTDEELQEIEDMLDGKALLDDDELLHWLQKDGKKMLTEIRKLKSDIEKITAGIRSGTKRLRDDKTLLLNAVKDASQTLSNLASGELTGDAKQIAENAAVNLYVAYDQVA